MNTQLNNLKKYSYKEIAENPKNYIYGNTW